MPNKGYRFSPEQRSRLSESHKGQPAWNKGMGGCKRGHDESLWVVPPSGVPICLGCKRENGARYREKNRETLRRKNRLERYGISEDMFDQLWAKQAGSCAICGAPFEGEEYRIDHDHQTGAVRGLLCASCNTAIGLLGDSCENMSRAIEYLRQPGGGI